MGVFGAEAHLKLADGTEFTSRQDCIEDFPVREKLDIGARGILSRRQISAIVRAIDRVESFDDTRRLMRVLAPGAR